MTELERKIGYEFKNRELMLTALTHASYANEKGCESYERFEFLGDAVLGFLSAEYIFSLNPVISEGKMTRLRSDRVCSAGLSAAAEKIGLGKYILLSAGEERNGGRFRPSLLEDVMEALICAVYLDSGLESAGKFVKEFILNEIDFDAPEDPKSALQELVQKGGAAEIRYEELWEKGPDHCKTFCMRVLVNGEELGTGEGASKKQAERKAAETALKKWQDRA